MASGRFSFWCQSFAPTYSHFWQRHSDGQGFLRPALRHRNAGSGHDSRDHDHPHHLLDHARGANRGPPASKRGRPRPRRNPMGNDPYGRVAERSRRHRGRHHIGPRSRVRRDNGRNHGDRQSSRNRQVSVRARLHHGQRLGQRIHRSHREPLSIGAHRDWIWLCFSSPSS